MRVIRLDVIDSTNLEALRRWDEGGPPTPLLVIAATQYAGRGRRERPWLSPRGGLWLSLGWPLARPPADYQALSLAVGLAAAEALEAAYPPLRCRLKWPNDLFAGQRKLAGILCEMHAQRPAPLVVVGLGVNANFPPEELGPHLLHPATSLLAELGRPVPLEETGLAVAEGLARGLAAFEREGLAPLRPRLEARLLWRGETVRCTGPGERTLEGRLIGVDEGGRLLLEIEGRKEAFLTGDLSLIRPERGSERGQAT